MSVIGVENHKDHLSYADTVHVCMGLSPTGRTNKSNSCKSQQNFVKDLELYKLYCEKLMETGAMELLTNYHQSLLEAIVQHHPPD